MIQAGSTVYHRPSRETWIVLAVSDDGTRILVRSWPMPPWLVADCDELPEPVRQLTEGELTYRQRAFGGGWR